MRWHDRLGVVALVVAGWTCVAQAADMDCSNITVYKPAASSDGYTRTKSSIVLAHGWFGFDRALGVDYWYRIPQELTRSGATVYVTQQAAMNGTEARGGQLLQKVRCISALEGGSKVNLIGHSQGSLDARYVAGEAPELVASVSTVSGLNHGSILSRLYHYVPEGSPVIDGLLRLGEAFGYFVDFLSDGGYAQSGDALIDPESGTVMGDDRFNRRYPGGVATTYCGQGEAVANGIRYYSWSGNVDFTNFFDPFSWLDKAMSTAFGFGEANDGFTTQCSSHLGQVIRDDYHLDHFDTVNQLLGLKSWRSPDPVSLYRQHANRLQGAGV